MFLKESSGPELAALRPCMNLSTDFNGTSLNRQPGPLGGLSKRGANVGDVVAQWMSTVVATVGPRATLREVVDAFRTKHVHHVCVVDASNRLVGILAERDVSRVLPSAWQEGLGGAQARIMATTRTERFMTPTPLVTSPGVPLAAAIRRMRYCQISALPVLEYGQLVGILTAADCIRARSKVDPMHPPSAREAAADVSVGLLSPLA
jgi:CBS domain-containing protein